MFHVQNKIEATIKKTDLWGKRIARANKQQSWIQCPFANHTEDVIAALTYKEQDSLVNLSCDSSLKLIFFWKNFDTVLVTCVKRIPWTRQQGNNVLMPFATICDMCEVGFSMLVALKTKYRNALSVEFDLRLNLMSIQPDIKSLTAEKQHHSSH